MPSFFCNKCCLCISLRVGSFIVGYMLSIYKTVNLLLLCINLMVLYSAISQNPELVTARASFISCLQIVMAFLSCMEMLMSINLLVGLHKNQRVHVKKFYVVYPILLTFAVITYLISLAVLGKSYDQMEWIIQIPELTVTLFEMYGIFIVRRCYLEMDDTDSTWETQNQATVSNKL